ncbi:MAG TPA: VanZ family protein [Noviherbaspirillum sp.]|jgi:VanZ family protein|uniref:VanZ family protein n=1 Tax=Noviherbaspirillum sp. TaxID=1926288 RepID=UPI002DDCCD71|nr:VanZ family protein [Noviherbaspirillum sp.]HEV2610248.1 VanZ family protein [Noviherbaspirillum sp.]
MTEQEQALPPTGSSFARAALLVYTLLVVYASWYPFSGWRTIGLAPWDFLLAPLPHYWTVFDVSTNVFGYMPFGLLVVFALYPAVRGLWAVAIAFIAGLLLSGLMEAGQTFLPSRVSSNLDLLPNAGGALVGAIGGLLLSRVFLEQSRLLELRKNWFAHDAGRGLIVVALWPLAQIYPQGYLFGHGQIMPILSDWMSNWLSKPIDLTEMARSGIQLTVQEYWLAETIITACGFAGAMLTMLCLLRKPAPKTALVLLLAGITLTSKWLASALLFTPQNAMAWLTPGAQGGLLIGAMLVGGLAFAPSGAQRRLAAVSLAASILVANFVPVNPYFVATLQAWLQGKFLNFNGAAQFLSLAWPFFAIWFLAHPMHRRKRQQRGV